jgi:hypothetical protein
LTAPSRKRSRLSARRFMVPMVSPSARRLKRRLIPTPARAIAGFPVRRFHLFQKWYLTKT